MQRSFFASAALALLLPLQAIAAAPSATELLSMPFQEPKPISFSLSLQTTGTERMTLKANGQREGTTPDKLWMNVTLDTREGSKWMHAMIEVRAVRGMAYAMVRSADGNTDTAAALRPLAGKWRSASLSSSEGAGWALSNAGLSGDVSIVKDTRFQAGHSFVLQIDGASLLQIVTNAMQSLQMPTISALSDANVTAKVDTNTLGEFRFATFKMAQNGSWLELTIQRQMTPVYVEIPKVMGMMSADSTMHEPELATETPMQQTVRTYMEPVRMTAPVRVQTNDDSSGKMPIVHDSDPSLIRRLGRLNDRSIIDLVGPNGKNIKLTVRTADSPQRWTTLNNFRSDFGRNAGILYVYHQPALPQFSAQDAFDSLDVIFFDATGQFISASTMPKCQTVVCPLTQPSTPVSYALEVPYGFIIEHAMGPLWRLSLGRYDIPAVDTLPELAARANARNSRSRQNVQVPTANYGVNYVGYERLATLAKTIAAKIRPADVRAVNMRRAGNDDVLKALAQVLADAKAANPDIQYAYIVRPTEVANTFQLLVDTFTYATSQTLDVNRNGMVDADEHPAPIGSTYRYTSFTEALMHTVTDEALDADVGIYVPIKDEDGNGMAVLAIVESKAGARSIPSVLKPATNKQ